ncbi:MAG: hypothetical protein WDO24_20460 [Pseudomonadota bacterium]
MAVDRGRDARGDLFGAGVERVQIGVVSGIALIGLAALAPHTAVKELDQAQLQRLVGLPHLVGRQAAAVGMRIHEARHHDAARMADAARRRITPPQVIVTADRDDPSGFLIERAVLDRRRIGLVPPADQLTAMDQLAFDRHILPPREIVKLALFYSAAPMRPSSP